MSATIIKYDTDEQSAPGKWLGQWSNFNVFARVGGGSGGGRCPSCGSIVYSKRHELCSICGDHLPTSCRFTHREARQVESILETERSRHRAWLRRVNAH